jgi:hypothetical protein
LVAASNGGRSPSFGFPNCPRPQLPQLSTDSTTTEKRERERRKKWGDNEKHYIWEGGGGEQKTILPVLKVLIILWLFLFPVFLFVAQPK